MMISLEFVRWLRQQHPVEQMWMTLVYLDGLTEEQATDRVVAVYGKDLAAGLQGAITRERLVERCRLRVIRAMNRLRQHLLSQQR